MSDADGMRLAIAACYLLPALVWGSMTVVIARITFRRAPGDMLVRLVGVATGLFTFYYALSLVLAVRADPLPGPSPGSPAALRVLRDTVAVFAIAIGPHLLPLSTVRGEPPRARWLFANYGTASMLALILAWLELAPEPGAAVRWQWSRAVLLVDAVAVGVLSVVQLRRLAYPGDWSVGGFGELRRSDTRWHAGVVAGTVVLAAILWRVGTPATAVLRMAVFESAMGLAAAVPFAVRFMAEGSRALLAAGVLLATSIGLYAGTQRLTPAGTFERDALSVLAMAFVLVPGSAWVRGALERVAFNRGQGRQEALQAVVHRLAPETGVVECCRRALTEALPLMQLRGAAVLLHDGEMVVAGRFDGDAIRAVWPRGAAAATLPARAFGGPDFRTLPVPLREAIIAAEVTGVLPIASARHRWGDLFAAAGLLTAIYSEQDVATWEGFAVQLALVLDAADLITRTVAAERSLAHAEKLAAVGEVAARIAHEIRNPVTAARSLAQQLAREPGGAFAEEHRLILAELERVERQVASLLRFARRDEYRFESVALDELVGGTVASLRPRLEAAGIVVGLQVAAGTTARADREKLRQVLVNLIENAIDALAESADGRRLSIAVATADGSATVRVTDNGPGVPARVLAQIFEPFFTLKPGGTGLGLAIARRTVEAHGGRIEATAAPGGGFAVTIVLPPRREAA